MFLVKECPACGRKLRFPIERGKLMVRCACGHRFLADPDAPSLYEGAHFDLSVDGRGKPSIRERMAGMRVPGPSEIAERAIKKLYGLKYTLQNFRLLPASKQRTIIITAVSAALALAAIILYVLYRAHAPARPPADGVII
jgi:hypothetical protein